MWNSPSYFPFQRNLTPEGLLPFEKQSKVKAATMGARMRCDVSLFVKENGLELVGVKYVRDPLPTTSMWIDVLCLVPHSWFQSKKA